MISDLLSKGGVSYKKSGILIINRYTLKKRYTNCMAVSRHMCIFVPM